MPSNVQCSSVICLGPELARSSTPNGQPRSSGVGPGAAVVADPGPGTIIDRLIRVTVVP